MAAQLNLIIEQGATFDHRLIWKDSTGTPIDLTNYEARMHIRKKIADLNFLLELTTLNGRLTLGGINGVIDISIDSEDTALLNDKTAVYDLEIVLAGTPDHVTRLVQGAVTISKEVTR